MQVWGITTVRDEADIVELTVRHMLAQGLDRLLVADNLSRDGTGEILARLAMELPVTVVNDSDPAHRQSQKMTALANSAAASGATWIVPFDADELWRGYGRTVREVIETTDATVLAAAMFDHYPRPTLRGGTLVERMPWNRTIEWAKVAFRWAPGAVITDGNHSVEGIAASPVWDQLLIDHYPYRSFAQFRQKMRHGADALDRANAPSHIGAHWRIIGAQPDWRVRLAWWRLRAYPKLRRVDRASLLDGGAPPAAR